MTEKTYFSTELAEQCSTTHRTIVRKIRSEISKGTILDRDLGKNGFVLNEKEFMFFRIKFFEGEVMSCPYVSTSADTTPEPTTTVSEDEALDLSLLDGLAGFKD